MIEGAIVFVLGFLCGTYKDSIKKYLNSKFNKKEEKEEIICD